MAYSRVKRNNGFSKMCALKMFNMCVGVFGGMFLFGFCFTMIGEM